MALNSKIRWNLFAFTSQSIFIIVIIGYGSYSASFKGNLTLGFRNKRGRVREDKPYLYNINSTRTSSNHLRISKTPNTLKVTITANI